MDLLLFEENIVKIKLTSFVTFLVLLFTLPSLYAAEFSADQIKKVSGMTITSKLMIKDKKMRMETEMPGNPMTSVIIIDRETGNNVMLMPQQKMYFAMPAGQDTGEMPDLKELEKEHKFTKKDLGEETVNGYKCNKIQIIFDDKSKGTMTQWFSEKLQFIVKMTSKNSAQGEFTMELTNIKETSIDNSVFKVPAGYSNMGAGFGNMMRQQ